MNKQLTLPSRKQPKHEPKQLVLFPENPISGKTAEKNKRVISLDKWGENTHAIRIILHPIECSDLPKRLLKIYELANRRYNENHNINANDADTANVNAVLTHSAGISGGGADC